MAIHESEEEEEHGTDKIGGDKCDEVIFDLKAASQFGAVVVTVLVLLLVDLHECGELLFDDETLSSFKHVAPAHRHRQRRWRVARPADEGRDARGHGCAGRGCCETTGMLFTVIGNAWDHIVADGGICRGLGIADVLVTFWPSPRRHCRRHRYQRLEAWGW